MKPRWGLIVAVALAALCALPSLAAAAPTPQPYRTNDFGGFHDILPAGANGLANGGQLLAWEADNSQRPPHNDDQYGMYRDLLYATPGLKMSQIGNYYKDSSFGVPPGHVESTISPRSDVTIVRDTDFGVPHIYGSTRGGAMFGEGYAAAQDRLFFIDALRNAGRGELSSFAGGANTGMDESVWADTPYTEADLQRQVDYRPKGLETETDQLRSDAQNFVDGINKYVTEAKMPLNYATMMPAEYAAIGKPLGPDPWKTTDLVSEGALIGGIFGSGGGGELGSALFLQSAIDKFGPIKGLRVWRDFRNANDPEAPTTVHHGNFPYMLRARHPHGVALPDPGTLQYSNVVAARRGSASPSSARSGILGGLSTDGLAGGLHRGNSNALLISGRESKTGRPVAVMGPQVAYFAPQILMEQDVHGPGIDAAGVAFPGVNLWVQLGRGRDYAWSATSSGQDIVDTFALPLCNAGGSKPTMSSNHYRFRGRCVKIENLDNPISWQMNPGDSTPSGSETLHAERTKMGIVIARAKVHGKPVAYTHLRSTYFHEIDSALGFSELNNPNKIHNAQDFQHAANHINLTFNWLYADNRDIAYFNSGWNPVRAPGTDPDFPVMGTRRNEWVNYRPRAHNEAHTPFGQHPQVINQNFITSWNNKQAHGYRSADGQFAYGSLFRSSLLDAQIRKRIRGPKKINLNGLIDAMEVAGTQDLRGDMVLPYALDVIRSQHVADPALRSAIGKLSSWVSDGAHRIDRNKDGTYEHSAAVRLMDAWWPLWMAAEFKRPLGTVAYNRLPVGLHDSPSNHLGSAFDDSIYGTARKDLRTVLGRNVRGRYSRVYCGHGALNRCRTLLLDSLTAALNVNPYGGNSGCGLGSDQACGDAIQFRTIGGISQPDMQWVNRPTFQQALSIQGHR